METKAKDPRRKRRLWPAVCLVLLLASPAALAQDSPPAPTPDRLAPPAMPAEPGQADLGAMVYYQVCMSCHGDQGQGLTDEFRLLWAGGDGNCWQAKCHGANHPEEGFQLVRCLPPVVGTSAMARYRTAALLFAYNQALMPPQDPGYLTEQEYWQVTAFLLRANGIETGREALGPENSALVPVAGAARAGATQLAQATPATLPTPTGTPVLAAAPQSAATPAMSPLPGPGPVDWPLLTAAALLIAAAAAALVLWQRRARPPADR